MLTEADRRYLRGMVNQLIGVGVANRMRSRDYSRKRAIDNEIRSLEDVLTRL